VVSSVLSQAGVPNNFKTHSIRGASVSKANFSLDTAKIMAAANWRSESVLRKFYLRNIHNRDQVDSRQLFQNSILG